MSDICPDHKQIVAFTRKWFDGILKKYFKDAYLCYTSFKKYQDPNQREQRKRREGQFEIRREKLEDVYVVFIAGATCRIPFIERWIHNQFPKAKLIKHTELEIITATGAAIHALQIENGEVKPYVSI